MTRRFWLFLYGMPNILGSTLALAGLVLFFSGVIKSYWLFIVAGLYAIGFLMAPRPRTPSEGLAEAWDVEALRDKLDRLVRLAERTLPASASAAVARIRQLITDILANPAAQEQDYQMQIVRQTVNRYLPELLDLYARLPAAFARLHPVRQGKTAEALLTEQLALIEKELKTIAAGLYGNDVQALAVHGEFLKRKLESGAGDFLSEAAPEPAPANSQ